MEASGYPVSTVSLFFLGAAAGPKENPRFWYHPVLIIGMARPIIGIGCRNLAQLEQKSKDQERKVRSRAALAARVRAVAAVAGVAIGRRDGLGRRLVKLHPVAEGEVVEHVHDLELEAARLPGVAVP